MRHVIQKRIVKEIQPEIVKYTCDYCGAVCGTVDVRKSTWYRDGKELHYCSIHPNAVLLDL